MEPSSQHNKRKRKRRLVWTIAAEKYLIDLWSENIDGLRGSKKNVQIHMEMAEKCKKANFNFTPKEVQWKLSNLTNKYRIEKKNIETSGGTPSTWVHFNKIDSILGDSKVFKIEAVILESAAASSSYLEDESEVECTDNFSVSTNSSASTNSPAKKQMQKHDFQVQLLKELRIANEIAERAVRVNEERNMIMRKMVEKKNHYHNKMIYLMKKRKSSNNRNE